MSAHKWQFASRFRRHAFGWRSDTPVQRIKEAITEIKQVARKEPVLAAEGAITLLEKLSPALEQVDSQAKSAIPDLMPGKASAHLTNESLQKYMTLMRPPERFSTSDPHHLCISPNQDFSATGMAIFQVVVD